MVRQQRRRLYQLSALFGLIAGPGSPLGRASKSDADQQDHTPSPMVSLSPNAARPAARFSAGRVRNYSAALAASSGAASSVGAALGAAATARGARGAREVSAS